MTISKWFANVPAIVMAFETAGCTAQLSSNTLDMQASYKGLLTKQIFYNLGEAIEEKQHFFPSQVLITQGTSQTVNTVTPTVSVPLPASTMTNTIAAAAATTVTNASATAWGNAVLGVSFADASQLAWGLTPQNDPDELRRLRALYLFAVKKDCDATDPQDWFETQYVMQGGVQNVNPAFIDHPGCVLCSSEPEAKRLSSDTSKKPVRQSELAVNSKLARLCGFVTKSPTSGYSFLKSYGLTNFYARDVNGEGPEAVDGQQAFVDFMLFILEAMSNAPVASYQGGPLPQKTQGGSFTLFSMPLGN
jgi:hypothetical protein